MRCIYRFIIVVIMFLSFNCAEEFDRAIFVDKQNTSGPWDGSLEHPYTSINEAFINAQDDNNEVIMVKEATYTENFIMRRGASMYVWGEGTPHIVGNDGNPAVLASGNNKIVGFHISGGSVAVRFSLSIALNGMDETQNEIVDCEISNTYRGIEITTPEDFDFGVGNNKFARIIMRHNWIYNLDGNGITSELNGPLSGELQISLDIQDNVIDHTFAGIALKSKGQSSNNSAAMYAGSVYNNLIFNNFDGINLKSEAKGSISLAIINNTIANNSSHGILASALDESGTSATGSTHPAVINNIIYGHIGSFSSGYEEFGLKTSAKDLSNNLFFQNTTHYYDSDLETQINSESDLNTPIVDGKVVYFMGGNNIVADPLFTEGVFLWKNANIYSGQHAFFLTQDGVNMSPCVDAGNLPIVDVGLDNHTTKTDFTKDTGIVDIGFHYLSN